MQDASRRLDTVHARHMQVHQDDICEKFRCSCNRLFAARCLAHDRHIRDGGQQRPQAIADERVIIDKQDA